MQDSFFYDQACEHAGGWCKTPLSNFLEKVKRYSFSDTVPPRTRIIEEGRREERLHYYLSSSIFIVLETTEPI